MKRSLQFFCQIILITLSLQVFMSCDKTTTTITETNKSEGSYAIHYEDDTIRVISKHFAPEENLSPGLTEVWKVNKMNNDSVLCAKSNPHCYGRSMDSIPSITGVWYSPYNSKMIVEGATCDAGHIATYIIDLNNGRQTELPTNCGFVGFTNCNDYLIASEKVNDIDYDLVLWYENIYIFDWDGKIVSMTSTKNDVIENALPQIHREAGWNIADIKLIKHTWHKPKYEDDRYYGSLYEVSYPSFTLETLQQLEDLCRLDKQWSKRGNKFQYIYDDYDKSDKYGMFVIMTVDPIKKTGIIHKGAYSNPKNAPKLGS